MYKVFWTYFPVIYGLPFLLATTRIDFVAQFGEKARWVVLIIGFIMVVNHAFKREPRHTSRLYHVDGIIFLFLSIFLYSASWSISPTYTYSRVISLFLLYTCSFWLLWRYAEQFTSEILIKYLLYTITGVLALNLIYGSIFQTHEFLSSRFQGFFVNPNNIGIITCLALPLAFGKYLLTRQRIDALVVLIISLNLIAAGSRSAMLGVMFAIIAIIISFIVIRPSRAILFAVMGVIVILLFTRTAYFEDQILREQTLENASNRTLFWDIAKIHIQKRPYLGHGFGSDAVFHAYYGIDLKKLGLRGYGAMSSYYGLAVAMGWPVTILFYFLLVSFIIGSMVIYWKDYYLMTLLGVLASGVIVSIFESVIYSAGNAFSFLFWVCLMLSVRHLRRRRATKPTPKRRQIVTNKFSTHSVEV